MQRYDKRGYLFVRHINIGLQGADGWTLAMELHAHNPKLAVLMISGQERSAASALPPSFEFLQKPFSLAELNARMCSMLSRAVAK
jgi:DNA-binding response OmpR family regulator